MEASWLKACARVPKQWAASISFMTRVLSMPTLQVCFERNIHSRTLEDIQAAEKQWEPAPPSYPHLDAASLLRPSSKPQVCARPSDSTPVHLLLSVHVAHTRQLMLLLEAIQPLVGQSLAGSRVKRSASATLCRCKFWHVQAAIPTLVEEALCNVTLENPLLKIFLLCRRASRRCTWKMRAVMRRHSRTQMQPPLLVLAEAGEAIDRNLAFLPPADAFFKSSSVYQQQSCRLQRKAWFKR